MASAQNSGMLRRVFLCFAGAYLLSYAFRSINAVIAPALTGDLTLSNADLGLLSAAYLLGFAGMQLPLGIWLDRYGARKTEAALLLFAAAGAAVFAVSSSLAGLWIGRALIGIGVSACLMAPFKAYRIWYPPERQSQLASWMLVAGTSGALATTIPVTAAMPLIGWRGIFWLMAGLILCAAAAIFLLLRKMEQQATLQEPAQRTTDRHANNAGYGAIFRDRYFQRLALTGAVNQGAFIALQTLWAGPWMITVLGMNKAQTAQILFIFNLSLLLAYLGLSWWAPRHVSYDGRPGWPVLRVIALGLLGTIALQTVMLAVTSPWAWILWPGLAVLATVTTLTQAQVSLSFPPSLAGRANSAYNLLLFIGAFGVQWGIGLLSDTFAARGLSAADAMRAAFGVCVLLQAAALAGFVFSRAQRAAAAPATA
jgi:predicted MFS family arabinose efflux permease